mmetsp:Transcript_91658/g.163131  ORF Transcript_91658/g.163131 Transcript_91658/m.163131 type:complete len:91 (+) Transcript_91658:139-411(+)
MAPQSTAAANLFAASKAPQPMLTAGTVFASAGVKPRYSPAGPLFRQIFRAQSVTPTYFTGLPGMPCTARRVRSTVSGYATTAPQVAETAP